MLNVEINMISWYNNNFFQLENRKLEYFPRFWTEKYRAIACFLQKKLTISKQAFDVPQEINKKKTMTWERRQKEIQLNFDYELSFLINS